MNVQTKPTIKQASMNNKKLLQSLRQMEACPEAVRWVEEKKYTLKQAWENCPRGDWMIWLLIETKSINKRERVLIAAKCAKTVLHLMKDERSKKAVEVAERYGNN